MYLWIFKTRWWYQRNEITRALWVTKDRKVFFFSFFLSKQVRVTHLFWDAQVQHGHSKHRWLLFGLFLFIKSKIPLISLSLCLEPGWSSKNLNYKSQIFTCVLETVLQWWILFYKKPPVVNFSMEVSPYCNRTV